MLQLFLFLLMEYAEQQRMEEEELNVHLDNVVDRALDVGQVLSFADLCIIIAKLDMELVPGQVIQATHFQLLDLIHLSL